MKVERREVCNLREGLKRERAAEMGLDMIDNTVDPCNVILAGSCIVDQINSSGSLRGKRVCSEP